jgi:hypothetical protein
MAGYHAVRRVKEARNLLTEIGGAFADFIIQPTPIFGDNVAATTISRGNRPARHIELPQHHLHVTLSPPIPLENGRRGVLPRVCDDGQPGSRAQEYRPFSLRYTRLQEEGRRWR